MTPSHPSAAESNWPDDALPRDSDRARCGPIFEINPAFDEFCSSQAFDADRVEISEAPERGECFFSYR